MKRFALWLFAVIAAGLTATAARAHAFLDHAVPPVGGTVSAPPPEIRLYFSEAIEPRFSVIELTSIDGRPVKTGPSTVDPRDQMQFVLPVPALPPAATRSPGTSFLSTPTRLKAISPSRSNLEPEHGAELWMSC
jgi:methionine-rich copper-binding protein CopC